MWVIQLIWFFRNPHSYTSNIHLLAITQSQREDISTAIRDVYAQCKGIYVCVAIIAGFGIIGFRDPHGTRSLILGRCQTKVGFNYILAFESVVLEALGFSDFEDIKASEAAIITREQASLCCLVVEENFGQ